MKRVAATKHPHIVRIPNVVGIVVVRIEPTLAVIVAIHVENVRIPIRISIVYCAIYTTA